MKFALICLLLLFANTSWGWPQNYGPFNKGKAPTPFGLETCTNMSGQKPNGDHLVHYEFMSTNDRSMRIGADSLTNGGFRVSLVGTSGVSRLDPIDMSGSALGPVFVYCGLLNEDSLADYVIATWNGGCGLGFEIYFLTFLISSDSGYAAHTFLCYDPWRTDLIPLDVVKGPDLDLYDLNNDGRPEFVHAMFFNGVAGKDKKIHNYWVYNLLKFRGTNVVSANAVVSDFPKWIWFTFKPNHSATDQLTAQQKQFVWRQGWRSWSNSFSRAMFPVVESFAQEQGVSMPVRGPSNRGAGGIP